MSFSSIEYYLNQINFLSVTIERPASDSLHLTLENNLIILQYLHPFWNNSINI